MINALGLKDKQRCPNFHEETGPNQHSKVFLSKKNTLRVDNKEPTMNKCNVLASKSVQFVLRTQKLIVSIMALKIFFHISK